MNTNMIYKACGWALAVALLTACSDEPGLSDGQPAGPHVNLNVSSGLQPASRTILQGEQNAQHVTRVSLYAYKHEDANDALAATYKGGMSFEEVDWQQDIETAMKKDGTSSQQQWVALPESWGIDEKHPENMSATYTLLAIGSDDSKIKDDGTVESEFLGSNSTAAYGLDNQNYRPGETIGESYATLQIQNDRTLDDIHRSELFAGTLTVKGSALYSGRVIILNRRVAGVKGYFVRIPEKVKNQEVKELRVVYWAAQPTSVPYYKRESEEGKFMDYGGKPATSPLIPDIGRTMQADDLDECTYFKIGRDDQTGEFVSQPGAEIEVDKGQEGTDEEVVIPLTAGSYVLPAPGAVGDDVTTLYVVLVSEPDTQGRVTILDKRRVFFVTSYESRAATRSDNTDDGTGIIVGQDGNAESQETERRYPIVANNYYTIGTPQEPIDMSNGESDVYLYVDPRWEGFKDLGTIIGKPNDHNQQ